MCVVGWLAMMHVYILLYYYTYSYCMINKEGCSVSYKCSVSLHIGTCISCE